MDWNGLLTGIQLWADIHYAKKVKDIKYPKLFCVVHMHCGTYSIYALHKKVKDI